MVSGTLRMVLRLSGVNVLFDNVGWGDSSDNAEANMEKRTIPTIECRACLFIFRYVGDLDTRKTLALPIIAQQCEPSRPKLTWLRSVEPGVFSVSDDFSKIDVAVKAIAAGQIVIVLDDEDRENEGDFICAAEKCTTEIINFMITNGRGMLCVPLLPETAQRLKLELLKSSSPPSPLQTAFTIAVDHHSVKTGITAEERCRTIHALADPVGKSDDFISPGHVHPLIAKEGGILRRAGHTEAAVDLVPWPGYDRSAH